MKGFKRTAEGLNAVLAVFAYHHPGMSTPFELMGLSLDKTVFHSLRELVKRDPEFANAPVEVVRERIASTFAYLAIMSMQMETRGKEGPYDFFTASFAGGSYDGEVVIFNPEVGVTLQDMETFVEQNHRLRNYLVAELPEGFKLDPKKFTIN